MFLHFPGFYTVLYAITSISIKDLSGTPPLATATVVRTGGLSPKRPLYILFIASKSFMSSNHTCAFNTCYMDDPAFLRDASTPLRTISAWFSIVKGASWAPTPDINTRFSKVSVACAKAASCAAFASEAVPVTPTAVASSFFSIALLFDFI